MKANAEGINDGGIDRSREAPLCGGDPMRERERRKRKKKERREEDIAYDGRQWWMVIESDDGGLQ